MTRLQQLRALPNQLTLLRLCVIPFVVISLLDGHNMTACILLLFAGGTDALDGLLARLLHQHTVLGQYLDPIADKLLLSTLFLVLMHMGLIPYHIAVLVFSRDLGILLISALLYITMGLRDFRPSIFGKLNTLAQIIAVIAVLLIQLSNVIAPQCLVYIRDIRYVSLQATAVLTITSALYYVWLVGRRLTVA
jgi:cardiolipin synthase